MHVILVIFLLGVASFLVLHRRLGGHRRNLPLLPGPRGLPLVGNVRDMTNHTEPPWTMYREWSRVYGDVFHYAVYGHHTVVLNSQKSIVELLDKRSPNYSDRPNMPMLNDLMNAGWNFSIMRYSDWWRLHRRTFHQFFQPRFVPEYYDIQRAATAELIKRLSTSPENFHDHVRHQSGSIILKVVYGYDLQTKDDPYLKLVLNVIEASLATAIHGSFWVDYFPMLKHVPAWMPGAGFKRKALKWKEYFDDLREEPWTWVKQAAAEGSSHPSFATRSAERLSVTLGEDSTLEDVIKGCAGLAYIAGADTTVSAISTFILAMTLHPEIQVRGQKEIDTVVGSGRLPDFDDRDDLPFINTLLQETLRWNPVAPLGIAHRALHDDIYEGYYIPAGSTIVPNVWAVTHDEALYGPNPHEFNPDRFTQADSKPPNPELFAFGFGRRICPGRYLAMNTLYLTIVHLLATFTIAKALDEEGNEVAPAAEFTAEFISHPKPFKCRFIPRKSSQL